MGLRRNTELFLLIAGAIPVFLLYAMFVAQKGGALDASTLIVPIGLTLAFTAAHIAARFLAPGADPAILPIVFVLSGIGVTFVSRLAPSAATNQVLWLFVSIAAMVAVLALVRNLETLARYKYSLGIAGLTLLLLPIFIGTEHYGSKLWIEFGGFSFQPGELAKILVVIFLASFLSENRELLSASALRIGALRIPRLRMLLPLLAMWAVSLVIVVWERDLGSAVLFFVIFVIMLYTATGRWFYPIVACVLLGIGAYFAYRYFGHVQVRVAAWLDPFADPQDSGYQIVQALYSIADGNLVGAGIGRGLCDLIPFVASDFIFAAIAEEMGFLGASAVILLFMLFAVRGFLTAARAKSDLAAFMAVGLTSSISFQAFVIIGGVTRLIPLTGVTLPFMSQGGSSLLSSFIVVALLLRCGDEGTGTQAEIIGDGVSSGRALGLHLETPESGVLGRRALSRRLTVITAGFTVLFAALIGNLAWYQVVKADEIRSMPINSHTIARSMLVERGSILTSDGVTLAESLRQEDGSYARSYPQGSLASHTVGYLSTRYGATGIESSFDSVLAGGSDYSTWTETLKSLSGNETPGQNVVLTINSRIQAAAEHVLEGRRGAVVVLDPATGSVLAKASAPTYSNADLDVLFAEGGSDGQFVDRSVNALYAPGSTFKVVTLAAALDSGVTSLDATYDAPASINIGGGTVTNYRGEDFGTIDLRLAFAYSSNTVFGQVAVQIGPTALVNQARAFGYGLAVGEDFRASSSLMPDPREMGDWETAWAGAGQPVGTQNEWHESPAGPQSTVMQNAMVAAAIANGGLLMNPYVVGSVISANGTVVSTTAPHALGQACSAATAAQVGDAMLATVSEGTGTAASIAGVNVAGKTGTAENGGELPDAWFVGYAPYEAPSVAVAVVIEQDGEHTATSVAGTVIQAALEALGGS